MVEVLLVYGSLVLFNFGVGHAAASLDSQQAIEVQPFEDHKYEVLIEEPSLSSKVDSGEWIADRD